MLPSYRPDAPPWLAQPPPVPGNGWYQGPPPVPAIAPLYGCQPIRCPPIQSGWGMPPGHPQWGWQGGVGLPSYPPPSPHHPKQWSDRQLEPKRPKLMRRGEGGGGGGGGGRGGGGKGKGDCEGEMNCEACCKSYKERQHYESHIRSHKKCPHPGCQFEAIHKVLNDHVLIHTVPKELFFDTPEEIAKWREDRRKNYPTQAAVARKMAAQREKEERGEVLPTRQHRYQRKGYQTPQHSDGGRFGRGRWRGRGRGRGCGQRMGRGSRDWSRQSQPADQATLPSSEQLIIKPPSEEGEVVDNEEGTPVSPVGTSDISLVSRSEQLLASEACVGLNEIDNKEASVVSQEIASEGEISDEVVNGGLPDRESSPAAISELNQLVTVKPTLPSLSGLPQVPKSDAFKESRTDLTVSSSSQRGSSRSQQRPRRRRQLTLLEKLLAPEIRRERNALLQCIKFIVKNNFFDSSESLPITDCPEDAVIPVASPYSPLGEDGSSSELHNQMEPHAPSSGLEQGYHSDTTEQTEELERAYHEQQSEGPQ